MTTLGSNKKYFFWQVDDGVRGPGEPLWSFKKFLQNLTTGSMLNGHLIGGTLHINEHFLGQLEDKQGGLITHSSCSCIYKQYSKYIENSDGNHYITGMGLVTTHNWLPQCPGNWNCCYCAILRDSILSCQTLASCFVHFSCSYSHWKRAFKR